MQKESQVFQPGRSTLVRTARKNRAEYAERAFVRYVDDVDDSGAREPTNMVFLTIDPVPSLGLLKTALREGTGGAKYADESLKRLLWYVKPSSLPDGSVTKDYQAFHAQNPTNGIAQILDGGKGSRHILLGDGVVELLAEQDTADKPVSRSVVRTLSQHARENDTSMLVVLNPKAFGSQYVPRLTASAGLSDITGLVRKKLLSRYVPFGEDASS